MVYLPDEADGIARLGKSFYINLRTMFDFYNKTFEKVIKTLKEVESPWVLDPVAVGLGELRTKSLMLFKEYPPKIIRGMLLK